MKQDNPAKIKAYLEKLGLNDKEAEAYLFLLSRGPQLVSALAKGCSLTRTHAYDIVRRLEELGLSHALGSEYGKKIQALSADQIKGLIDQKEREILFLKQGFAEIAGALNSMTNIESHSRPLVSYYQGRENLRKLVNFSLHAESRDVRIAGSEIDLIEKLGNEFMISYHVRRRDKEIRLRSLRPGTKRGLNEVFCDDKKYLREVRLRPKGEISLKSNIVIWDYFTAIYSLGDEPFGILIDNKELAIMMKSWFDFIWSKSKNI